MSGYLTTDGNLDVSRLEMALQDLEAGELGHAEREELMAVIHHSPAAQRTYLRYFEVSAVLHAEAATHAEHGHLPKIVAFDPPSRLFNRALLAAAALVLLAALVGALIQVTMPEARALALTAAVDTRWTVTGKSRDADGQTASVQEGSTLRVASGVLELRLKSGATMVMQGPAHVFFPKLNQPVVKSGWLWIDSASSGEKFDIRTPELRIRNLGTRFGVNVPAEGPAELHLITGSLEVVSEAMPEKVLKLSPQQHGLAISSRGEPDERRLARDPFPGIAGLLSAPPNYLTTILGQNPAAYWRIEDAAGASLQNEVDGEAIGRTKPGVSSVSAGPRSDDGLKGFDATNQAVRLTGVPGDAQVSLGAAPPRHQGLLFQENFQGGTGPLNRRKTVAAGKEVSWVSSDLFRANGWISPGMASATLAFEPVDGVVYTLEGSLRGLNSPQGTNPWVALGFADGQSTSSRTDDRFVLGTVTGRAWMLFRGRGSNFENTTHDLGDSNPMPWQNWSGGVGGDVDMRVVLDTTQGYGNWTASYFARRPGKGDYVMVGQPRTLPNEAIRSVGFAVSGGQLQARITNFSLRADAVSKDPATIIRADRPASLAKSEGAVSCWLRRDSGSGRKTILWSAGKDFAENFIHVRLEADGRVGFFIENGRYDLLITSEEKIVDGRWHHLVASWSPSSADLYLDGREIAWERESRELVQGDLSEFQFGSGGQRSDFASFVGDVDEIAAWDRALTAVEVAQQYRSAKEGRPPSEPAVDQTVDEMDGI